MSVVGSNKAGFNGEVGMKFGSPRWHQVGRLNFLKEKRHTEWRREGGFLLWGFTLKMKGIRGSERPAEQSMTLLKKKKKKNICGLIFTIYLTILLGIFFRPVLFDLLNFLIFLDR